MSCFKKILPNILITLLFCLELTSEASARRSVVTSICSQVQERTAVSCLTTSPALLKSEQIFARSQFTHPNSDATIWHVWLNNNQEIFRKKISSQGGGFRAITSVYLKNRDGHWRFQVLDEDEKILETIYFVTSDGPNGIRGRLLTESQPSNLNWLPQKPQEQPQKPADNSKIDAKLDSVRIETLPHPQNIQQTGHWFFNLGPRLNFTRLNSTQNANSSTAKFLSEENFGIHLGVDYFRHDFSQVTSFFINLDNNKYKSVSGKSLNSLPPLIKEISAAHEIRNILPTVHGKLILGLKDDFFDRASSSIDLNFSRVLLPFAGLEADYEIAKSSSNTADLGIRFLYFFKTSNSDYVANESHLWRLQLSDRYSLTSSNDQFLVATVFADKQNQTTSLISRTKENIGLELLYSWDIAK